MTRQPSYPKNDNPPLYIKGRQKYVKITSEHLDLAPFELMISDYHSLHASILSPFEEIPHLGSIIVIASFLISSGKMAKHMVSGMS